jgi:hypothetical protein
LNTFAPSVFDPPDFPAPINHARLDKADATET